MLGNPLTKNSSYYLLSRRGLLRIIKKGSFNKIIFPIAEVPEAERTPGVLTSLQ